MRDLLMFVGLAGLGFGALLAFSRDEIGRQLGQLLFILGAVWGAAGFAAEDIVSAIRKRAARDA